MEPKLTEEQAREMLAHFDALYAARMLTEDELHLVRTAVRYGRRGFVIIKATPRFITGLVAFLAAVGALMTYWPF